MKENTRKGLSLAITELIFSKKTGRRLLRPVRLLIRPNSGRKGKVAGFRTSRNDGQKNGEKTDRAQQAAPLRTKIEG